jgi:hypothetical protein
LPDYGIDFNRALGAVKQWSVAYSVCYIYSDAARSGLLIKVGSDDEARIYLNTKEIYQRAEARGYAPDNDVVAGVELKAGVNVLVFKVVNETGGWMGSVRSRTPKGNLSRESESRSIQTAHSDPLVAPSWSCL